MWLIGSKEPSEALALAGMSFAISTRYPSNSLALDVQPVSSLLGRGAALQRAREAAAES